MPSFNLNMDAAGSYLKVNYSTSYNRSTNKTTVTITSLEAYVDPNDAWVTFQKYGLLKVNGVTAAKLPAAASGQRLRTEYNEQTLTDCVFTPVVLDNAADGSLTVTVSAATDQSEAYPAWTGNREGIYICSAERGYVTFTVLNGTSHSFDASQSRGAVHIANGANYESYMVYIANGSSYSLYLPYICDGTNWNLCT